MNRFIDIPDVLDTNCEYEALITEREGWVSANNKNFLCDRPPLYGKADFLDMAQAFRQLGEQSYREEQGDN